MISTNPHGFLHSSYNVVPVRALGLSPLKPQRGRTDYKSYALLFVLIRIHVTATMESVNSPKSFQPAAFLFRMNHNSLHIRAIKKESHGLF